MSVGGQLPGTFGESFHVFFLLSSFIVPCSSRLTLPEVMDKPAPAAPAPKDISDPINIIKLELHSHTLPAIPPPSQARGGPGVPADSPHPPARAVLQHATPSLV